MSARNVLREARERLRMTQAHLAGAAGVSERTVIRAEGGRPVSAESERALCAVLGLSPADLAPGAAPARPATAAGCIAAMGETVLWEAGADHAGWRAANAFRGWAALAATLSAACAASVGLMARAAWADPSLLAPASGLSAAGILAVAYLGHRARVYAALDREVAGTTYAMTGDALWIVRRGTEGTRTMTRRELPAGGVAVPTRAAYLLWPRVRDAVADLPGGPVRLHGLAAAGGVGAP